MFCHFLLFFSAALCWRGFVALPSASKYSKDILLDVPYWARLYFFLLVWAFLVFWQGISLLLSFLRLGITFLFIMWIYKLAFLVPSVNVISPTTVKLWQLFVLYFHMAAFIFQVTLNNRTRTVVSTDSQGRRNDGQKPMNWVGCMGNSNNLALCTLEGLKGTVEKTLENMGEFNSLNMTCKGFRFVEPGMSFLQMTTCELLCECIMSSIINGFALVWALLSFALFLSDPVYQLTAAHRRACMLTTTV